MIVLFGYSFFSPS